MADKFWIKYEIERIDCRLPKETSGFEGFIEHVLTGQAMIGFGDKSVSTGRCGLLGLWRSLIRLFTFPALYGREAFETVLDRDIDFRSDFQDGKVVFTIVEIGRSKFTFEVSVVEALQVVGAFHHELLTKIFEAWPDIRRHGWLLIHIPDAFALAPMLPVVQHSAHPACLRNPEPASSRWTSPPRNPSLPKPLRRPP